MKSPLEDVMSPNEIDDLCDTEAFEERAAIMEYDGGLSRAEAEKAAAEDVQAQRHKAEVRWMVWHYWPNGDGLSEQLALVEKRRGKPAADRLREDCRTEWRRYRDEVAGQA